MVFMRRVYGNDRTVGSGILKTHFSQDTMGKLADITTDIGLLLPYISMSNYEPFA